MPTEIDTKFFDNMIEATQKAAAIAGTTARALVVGRVFGNGQAADGSSIGTYSTKPVHVGASSFLTKGGAAKVLGSNAKRRKLYGAAKASGEAQFIPKSRPGPGGKGAIFFPEGYKGIRKADGRQTQFVDLRYTGQMQNDFHSIPTRTGFNMGFLTSNNGAKMRGNEKRFGKEIATLSQAEINQITETYFNEFNRLFN